MPKEYSTKFKAEVIKRYQSGESILALSQELCIAQSTIYHWRKEYCSIKTANRTYTPKEFDALSRRLENWSMKWRSSNAPVTLQMCRCRKSCPF